MLTSRLFRTGEGLVSWQCKGNCEDSEDKDTQYNMGQDSKKKPSERRYVKNCIVRLGDSNVGSNSLSVGGKKKGIQQILRTDATEKNMNSLGNNCIIILFLPLLSQYFLSSMSQRKNHTCEGWHSTKNHNILQNTI